MVRFSSIFCADRTAPDFPFYPSYAFSLSWGEVGLPVMAEPLLSTQFLQVVVVAVRVSWDMIQECPSFAPVPSAVRMEVRGCL